MPFESLGNPFRPQEKPTVSDVEAVRDLLGDRDADELARLTGRKTLKVEPGLALGAPVEEIKLSDEQKRELAFQEFENQLRKEESKKLAGFFGMHIDVPKLPKEITLEKIEFWKENQFELHYLPEMDLTEMDKDGYYHWKEFPGWERSPVSTQHPGVEFNLPGGWLLFDMRPLANYAGHDLYLTYENDELIGGVLASLRSGKKPAIETISDVTPNAKSRFGITRDELGKLEVKRALADALQIKDPRTVGLATAAEDHILERMHRRRNVHYKVAEWASDIDEMETDPNEVRRAINIGFRPLVHFKPD